MISYFKQLIILLIMARVVFSAPVGSETPIDSFALSPTTTLSYDVVNVDGSSQSMTTLQKLVTAVSIISDASFTSTATYLSTAEETTAIANLPAQLEITSAPQVNNHFITRLETSRSTRYITHTKTNMHTKTIHRTIVIDQFGNRRTITAKSAPTAASSSDYPSISISSGNSVLATDVSSSSSAFVVTSATSNSAVVTSLPGDSISVKTPVLTTRSTPISIISSSSTSKEERILPTTTTTKKPNTTFLSTFTGLVGEPTFSSDVIPSITGNTIALTSKTSSSNQALEITSTPSSTTSKKTFFITTAPTPTTTPFTFPTSVSEVPFTTITSSGVCEVYYEDIDELSLSYSVTLTSTRISYTTMTISV